MSLTCSCCGLWFLYGNLFAKYPLLELKPKTFLKQKKEFSSKCFLFFEPTSYHSAGWLCCLDKPRCLSYWYITSEMNKFLKVRGWERIRSGLNEVWECTRRTSPGKVPLRGFNAEITARCAEILNALVSAVWLKKVQQKCWEGSVWSIFERATRMVNSLQYSLK